ncbi:unnamed protein product [Mycena citricolor]|uniref:Tc1-like transposase DDE domain-containing protein n=1 Tax=Mycena citricolor TaxID=2018698 RepID=A0AAD2JYE3_9AGAR|nr:unnamed protein product [Mycena citricolor]
MSFRFGHPKKELSSHPLPHTMGRRKTASERFRTSNGTFASTRTLENDHEGSSDRAESDVDATDIEMADNDTDSNWTEQSDESGSDESESEDETIRIVLPSSWGEAAAPQTVFVSSMSGAERAWDGPGDRDTKAGKKRGPYGIGGDSDREVRRKRQKVMSEFRRGSISAAARDIQLAGIERNAAQKPRADAKLTSFFTRAPIASASRCSPSPTVHEEPDNDDITYLGVRTIPVHEDLPILCTMSETPERRSQSTAPPIAPPGAEAPSSSPEPPLSEADQEEDPSVLAELKTADDVADWVEGVIGEEMPKSDTELCLMANEGVRLARKMKDYRSEVLWASLVKFYTWKPRHGRGGAALRCARALLRGPAFARVLCQQARHVESFGALKASRQGQRSQGMSLLDNEAFLLGLQRWLRTLEAGKVNPKLLQQYVNETLLPSHNLRKKSISRRQSRRWLYRLGYRRKQHSKGVYWDGHERKDVKKHRAEFIAQMSDLENFRPIYDGNEMSELAPPMKDAQGWEHILIYQDESSFHDNDYQNVSYYLRPGEQVLKKKGRGRLIMVSGYICERFGNLALTDDLIEANNKLPTAEQLDIVDSRVVIYPNGKETGDNYWNMDQMIEQLRNAIKIAKRLFPKAVIHWVFDNSSCHGSLPHDAISVSKMNLKPGGKNLLLFKDTIIPMSNPFGKGGQTQSFQFPAHLSDDDPYKKFEGQNKGMQLVLEERGYDVRGLKKQRKVCEQERTRKPHLSDLTPAEEALADAGANDTDDEDDRPVNCCLRRLLENEEDIKNQCSLLQEIVEEAGGVCHFLPKFHPELNPIEYFWGWVKNYFRQRSQGNFAHAQKLIKESLESCPVATIRCFFRRAFRYLSVYKAGKTGYLAEFAVKKYASHRSVPAKELEEMQKEWEVKQEKARILAASK